MPFLVRIIAQRVIAGFLGLMTFLGIAPEATIPTDEQVEVRQENQRRLVEQVLEIRNEVDPEKIPENIITIVDETSNRINEAAREIENTPSPSQNIKIESNKEPEDIIVDTVIDQKEDPEIVDVVVNIICTQKKGNFTVASTGSGVLISPRGVVLTNAHVAQMFLLEDAGYGTKCGIYKENIPTFGYTADILYISEEWVRENYKVITQENPRGTGEEDYALLLITDNTNPVLSLPSSFPYASFNLNRDLYVEGRAVTVAGFPGAPTSILDLAKAGPLRSDLTQITKLVTFGSGNVDRISTDVTSVAQKGASGGGIFYDDELVAITVTTSKDGSGSYINAIVTPYINEDIDNDWGDDLQGYISGNLSQKVRDFEDEVGRDLAKLLNDQ